MEESLQNYQRLRQYFYRKFFYTQGDHDKKPRLYSIRDLIFADFMMLLFFIPFTWLSIITSQPKGILLIIGGFVLLYVIINYFYITKYIVYRNLKKYYALRGKIETEKEILGEMIIDDIASNSLSPKVIEKIQITIDAISELYSFVGGLLIRFYKVRSILLYKKDKIRVKEYVNMECEWLLEYMRSFHTILHTWLESHTGKVQDYKSNMNITDKNIALAKVRLENYVTNLEKVRARL